MAEDIPLMKRAGIAAKGLLAGLLIGGAGAGYLFWNLNNQRIDLLGVIDQAKTTIEQNEAACKERQDALAASASLVTARLELYHAANAMSEDNYGTARDLIAKVAKQLESSSPAPGSPELTAIADLKQIAVGQDTRDAAVAELRRIERLLAPPAAN